MDNVSSFLGGALVGLSVAAPVGPMGMLLIRRTMTGGIRAGITTGAGATTVQLLYCAALVLGMHRVGSWMDENREVLNAAGGAIMLLFAYRLLRTRGDALPRQGAPVRSLAATYASAVAFNLTNPMMALLLAGSTAAIFGGSPPIGVSGCCMLLGLLAGSLIWWVGLSTAVASLRVRLGAGMLARINEAAALAMAAFGLAALVRVLAG